MVGYHIPGMELNSATRTVKAGLSARSFDENGLWFFMTSVTGYESDDRVNDKDNNGSYIAPTSCAGRISK